MKRSFSKRLYKQADNNKLTQSFVGASYVRIFDTTLRDGEQSPGATLTSKEKLDIARQLAKLGVDIIEAGFPVASPDDFEAVRSIALEVGNAVDEDGYVPVICGLARTTIRCAGDPRARGGSLRATSWCAPAQVRRGCQSC